MSDLQRAVRQLGPAPTATAPTELRPAAPIPASAGKAPNGSPAAGGTGGGDLTEKDFSQRTYWPDRTLKSTDGVITWVYRPPKAVVMTDAAGKTVVLTFAEPTL